MAHGHENEDWLGSDHSPREHTETLANGTSIHVLVRQLAADKYESDVRVLDSDGKELRHVTKLRENDPGPATEVLKFAIDEAKRIAGGHRGAPLDNHHQKTPI